MFLFLVAYLGGVLTILSPCILPVLPFVFARGDQPFLKSGLPLLLGMALTFAGVASLAAVGGGWAVQANQYGRWMAIVLMAVFGLMLLFPQLAEHATRPLVAWGSRLSASASRGASEGSSSSILPSLLLGVATGLLWAPCAGPILGLVLTGAALNGASAQTSLLLLAYAAGAATSLAGALLVGGRLFKAMKRSLGAGEWIRRGIGVALLCGVAAIALGLDTGVLAQVSLASTSRVEQVLVDKVRPAPNTALVGSDVVAGAGSTVMKAAVGTAGLPIEGAMPSLAGAVQWLNSEPLTTQQLRGKVVLVDFWTYSCINCLRALPYVRAWAEKYKDKGLVVIGVPRARVRIREGLKSNQWSLAGEWKVGGQSAVLDRSGGRISYQFHARDLHLVLGPGKDGNPVRFRILIDGKPPGADHGMDVDAQGNGTVGPSNASTNWCASKAV